jgi:FkbM family methyltransferase
MGPHKEWLRRVTADKQENESVQAVDVDSLISMKDYHHISVLKVDLEGAERELFARSYASWLDRTETSASRSMGLNAV